MSDEENFTFKVLAKFIVGLFGGALLSVVVTLLLLAHNPGNPLFNMIAGAAVGTLLVVDSLGDNLY